MPAICDTNQFVSNTLSKFEWDTDAEVCTAAGEIIGVNEDGTDLILSSNPRKVAFNRRHINNLIRYINNAYSQGESTKTNISLNLNETDENFISAKTCNAIRSALIGLGNSKDDLPEECGVVEADKSIIYGSYFTGLKEFVNNTFKFHENQCNSCITCQTDCSYSPGGCTINPCQGEYKPECGEVCKNDMPPCSQGGDPDYCPNDCVYNGDCSYNGECAQIN